MSHKNFHARVNFDPENGLFIGRIVGISDVLGFHGESVRELTAAFHEAVDDDIGTCRKVGKEPQRAYPGKLMLRVPPDLHAQAARAAELSGKSLNQWDEDVLHAAVGS